MPILPEYKWTWRIIRIAAVLVWLYFTTLLIVEGGDVLASSFMSLLGLVFMVVVLWLIRQTLDEPRYYEDDYKEFMKRKQNDNTITK